MKSAKLRPARITQSEAMVYVHISSLKEFQAWCKKLNVPYATRGRLILYRIDALDAAMLADEAHTTEVLRKGREAALGL